MPSSSLSILIALYNEEEFIAPLLEKVLCAPLPDGMEREIIVVDDGSSDGSAEVVEEFLAQYPHVIRLIRHERNQGKGAAIRTGLQHARGEFGIIQDADLEYDPDEYAVLLRPILKGHADVVYGSRFLGTSHGHRVLYFWHSVGNKVLTLISNAFTDLNLTDMESCYKAMTRDVAKKLDLQSQRFGVEPEITCKVSRLGVRIYEVPVSYHGRTYSDGKKIGFKDAIQALVTIIRYAWWTPPKR